MNTYESKLDELRIRAFNMETPSKKKVQRIVEQIAENEKFITNDIVRLYAYFNGRPKPPKKAKTVFDWVARAVGDQKDPFRRHLSLVMVEENRIYATDGRRLHMCANVDNMKPGRYRVDGTFFCELDDTSAAGHFPNTDRVIPDQNSIKTTWIETPSELSATPGINATSIEIEIACEKSTIIFDRRYLEDTVFKNERIEISAVATNKAVRIIPRGVPAEYNMIAVVMPMRD